MKKSRRREELLSYEHFQVEEPSKINYETFEGPWCKYCGARYSRKFYESKFGPDTLCDIHYKIMRKQQLKLPDETPKVPLQPEKNTELLFLNKIQE